MAKPNTETETILGISFFNGPVTQAIQRIERGGLAVAPSGTCFERFLDDADYRRAIVTADLALADSGLMVTLWRVLRRRKVQRISGLTYLKELLSQPRIFENGRTLWILPNASSRQKLQDWSAAQDHPVSPDDCYLAPIYGADVRDPALLDRIAQRRPSDIIIGIGAGAQERLGWALREHAGYRPAIHCIGGALGFVTGDQIAIPAWADQFYLGWFLRLLSQPRAFLPRLWRARLLPRLILRYGAKLPPLRNGKVEKRN